MLALSKKNIKSIMKIYVQMNLNTWIIDLLNMNVIEFLPGP